jgi:saccharopine dehydrogenase-like NADP-dependent oxidoreductase
MENRLHNLRSKKNPQLDATMERKEQSPNKKEGTIWIVCSSHGKKKERKKEKALSAQKQLLEQVAERAMNLIYMW